VTRPLPKHATRPNRTIRFLPGRIEVRMTIHDPSVEAIVRAFRAAQRSTVEMQVHNDEIAKREAKVRRSTIGSASKRDHRSIDGWLVSDDGKGNLVVEPRARKSSRRRSNSLPRITRWAA
jgi:hypothetical protein